MKKEMSECVGLWLAEGDSKTKSEVTFTNNCFELIIHFHKVVLIFVQGSIHFLKIKEIFNVFQIYLTKIILIKEQENLIISIDLLLLNF